MGTLAEISALLLHIVHIVFFATKAIMLETYVYLKFFFSVWKVQTGAKKAYHARRGEKRKIPKLPQAIPARVPLPETP